VIDVFIAVLCVGFAMMPILPAYGTPAALTAVMAGLIAAMVPVLLGAFLRWPFPLTMLVGIASYVVVGGAVAFGRDLVWGVVPSGQSMTSMLTGTVTSWKEALTLEPPLGQSDGVLVLPFLLAFLGAFLVSWVVGWRNSWLTTIIATGVVTLVLITSILWGTQETVLGSHLGVGLFMVLTVWATWRMKVWRPRRWASMSFFLAAVIAASTVLSGQFAPQAPRFVLRSIVIPPFDPRDQVSPLSLYRHYVKDRAETPLVSVSGLPENGLVRLATLDAYDGVVWSVSGDQSRAGSGAFRRIGERIEQTAQGDPYDVRVKIEELDGVWTPTIGYLSAVDFDSGSVTDFRFNDATGAAVTIGGLRPGTSYRLQGVLPATPTDEELGETGVGKIALADVANIPDIITQEAIAIGREGANVPLVIRKYEEYFQTRGYFSHGEATGGYPSLSGHGADRMDDLFSAELMVGDAEQYASAMALLARSQGVPARVVVGFIPEEGASDVTFTGADLSAWVEIYYNEYGWVQYFPTPPSSQTPNASQQEKDPEPEPEAVQLPPDPRPPATPPAVNTEDTEIDAQEDPIDESYDWFAIVRITAVVGIPLILLLAGPLIVIALKARRRGRRKRAPGQLSVIGGWQETLDDAFDLGIRPEKDLTRREAARFIETSQPQVPMRRLADTADRAHFSHGEWSAVDSEQYWLQVEESRRALARSVSWRRRVFAKVSPASLRARKAQRKADAEAAKLTAELLEQSTAPGQQKSVEQRQWSHSP
jgi:transglutaminase-like putative cysteine protease/cytochrome c-type biogenesis protein CcmH/NrfF